ncbi:hypothetical protein D3C78_1778250 [compost metagenome]
MLNLLDSLIQSLTIAHLHQCPHFAQLRCNLKEIEHVRPTQHRHTQRCRFQQIVATTGHQTTADEGDIRQRIEEQQFTHRVAEQHLVPRQHLLTG